MLDKYDRQKAVAYARKWALNKNPEFGYFGGIGGDCTNFISQCLFAGGGVMSYNYLKGWYFNSMSDRSPSWTSVAYLQSFLLRSYIAEGPVAQIVKLQDLEEGDIIQLRQNKSHFNHSVIVSKVANQNIYVCAHSNDALDRRLESYSAFEVMPLKIIGIKK